MKTPRLIKLRRAVAQLRRPLKRRALILMYHRVAEVETDPWLLSVAPQHFDEHLAVLRRRARLISLPRLLRKLQDRSLPRGAVAVTFDDGYSDNLRHAKPLLERHDVPATVFVTTGYMGAAREFWWDDLERLILQPGALPEAIRLSVGGEERQWRLGEGARLSAGESRRHRRWRAWGEADPSPRHRLFRELNQLLRTSAEGERRAVLEDLTALAGAATAGRPSHRPMTPEEVRLLAAGGLVEVGAHTVTHPVLSALPPDAQRVEIQRSKAHLEDVLGREVNCFAYPYGAQSDYTTETIDIVREARFAGACSTNAGLVRPDGDRFQLPRFAVRDWDGETFARQLEKWSDE